LKEGFFMQIKNRCLPLAITLFTMLVTSGCGLQIDWKALYNDKLGQPVTEINAASLNSDFVDSNGNLTRIAWARLADQHIVLLGLPAHGNPTQQVVEDTVVLSQEEFTERCRDAFQHEDINNLNWTATDEPQGNTFLVHPTFQRPNREGVLSAPDHQIGYCEFAFLPEGWKFRVVQSQGIIKTNIDGVETCWTA
jgi:hypothetical protein